ncbi:MAG: O-methyltransferase [Clostridia bacterium]|nr:O-methyltransferase [Clostridia bacterium]
MVEDNINYEYIIRYIRRTLKKSEGQLAYLERYAAENEVPISQPETIKLIELLIKISGARRVLEIGSAIGYSAIRMVYAGAESIDTIEISPEIAEEARQNIAEADVEERVNVICGDANEVLPRLEGEYDLIFMDAAKAQYNRFFENCMRLLKTGGILISDNILYKGMTATDELVLHRKRTIVKRLRDYVDMLCSNPMLDTDILPLGDGVALSLKTGDGEGRI